MTDHRAIVYPVKGKKPPKTGSIALIAATQPDMGLLSRLADCPVVEERKLYMSTLRVFADDQQRFTAVGPFMGAPYAAMIVESLKVWGVESVLFVGWSGAVSRRVKTGDIILPDSAISDEGTSGHYRVSSSSTAHPSLPLFRQTKMALEKLGGTFHEGKIWSTDAIFRETVQKVKHYQQIDALAVDMELSAVFTVADFRRMHAAGLLVVSDEISNYEWHPGFARPEFKAARVTVCKAALMVATTFGTRSVRRENEA
jgi:purine-nucleoside phosphorylase